MMNHPAHRRRRGAILIITIFIVFALASIVIVMGRSSRTQSFASSNITASLQASTIERGAEQYVLAVLTEQKDSLSDLTEDVFAGIQVGDGYFWIVKPDYGDNDNSTLFGLTDESGKLNINTANSEQLIRLPNMTDDLAGAIIDWRDSDSTVTGSGAENEYYSALTPPYQCKNAPFETVEEILLVKGGTREMLYGNGQAGPMGQRNSTITANSNRQNNDYQTTHGLYDLLTVYNTPAVTTNPGNGGNAGGGQQKININDRTQRTRLRDLLTQQTSATRADAIISAMGGDNFIDAFDFYFKAKLTQDEFGKIFGSITTGNPLAAARAKININTAPSQVLFCLPGLETADVDKILSARQGSGAGSTSVAWLATALDKKAVGLADYITGSSTVYSADIVAVSGTGRAFKRCRIVVDAAGSTPQIVYRRDLTDHGWPMDPQILTALRSGQGAGAWSGGRSALPGGNSR